MAGTTRIPKAQLTGVYGAMIKRMTTRMLGGVPELTALGEPRGVEVTTPRGIAPARDPDPHTSGHSLTLDPPRDAHRTTKEVWPTLWYWSVSR